MSQYANYTVASDDYDKTRIPVGVDTILGCLARTGVPLGEQTVREAGCGTGNYLQALRRARGHTTFLAEPPDYSGSETIEAQSFPNGAVSPNALLVLVSWKKRSSQLYASLRAAPAT